MRRWAAAGGVFLAALAVQRGSSAEATRAAWTASPLAVDEASLNGVERDALARCGRGEAGLVATARVLLGRKLAGAALPELDEMAEVQRAEGEPHPWARAWAVRAPAIGDAVMARLDAWLAGPRTSRRCGAASGVAADGTTSLVVVTVEALADVAPLPARARTGQWLSLEARLHTAARGASVIVVGSSGAPRTVPSWTEGSTVRARFAADAPGELSVQVVADLPRGPRPVLEATVFVDVDPSLAAPAPAAPGEDTANAGSADEQLLQMVDAARASVGAGPLVRDARLDAIARAHAARMTAARELAHDVGDGDPAERMQKAGLEAHTFGENVAHAPSIALAHRALWRSASHRMNLLRPDFDRIGVAVTRDATGDAWVDEVFAGGLSP